MRSMRSSTCSPRTTISGCCRCGSFRTSTHASARDFDRTSTRSLHWVGCCCCRGQDPRGFTYYVNCFVGHDESCSHTSASRVFSSPPKQETSGKRIPAYFWRRAQGGPQGGPFVVHRIRQHPDPGANAEFHVARCFVEKGLRPYHLRCRRMPTHTAAGLHNGGGGCLDSTKGLLRACATKMLQALAGCRLGLMEPFRTMRIQLSALDSGWPLGWYHGISCPCGCARER